MSITDRESRVQVKGNATTASQVGPSTHTVMTEIVAVVASVRGYLTGIE